MQMDLSHRDFAIVLAQAVVFTPGGQVAMPRILIGLLERWADLFDGEPVSLPNNTPLEFPRIVLSSLDEQVSLEISGIRAAFTWRKKDGQQALDVEKFVRQSREVLDFYLEMAPAMAGRLALILHRVALNEEPAKTLAKHFCRERWLIAPLNRPETFELHAHKSFQLSDEFKVNSWIRCKSGDISTQPTDPSASLVQPVVFVEQDINTLSEIAGDIVFNSQQIQSFLTSVFQEADHVLSIYFPGSKP